MNLLGKVFSFVVLGLSCVFFALALAVNATHRKDKTELDSLRNQARTLQTSIDELKKSIETKKTELAQEQFARRSALSSLQTQLISANKELAQANSQLKDLNSVNTAQTQKLADTIETVRRLTSENDLVKEEMNKVIEDRNQQRRNVISLTDKLNNLTSVEADMKAQVKQLQEESTYYQAAAETAKAALASAGIIDPEDVPPEDVKGIVLAVNSDLVEISLGRDDGVRAGHQLEIFRGSSYLGRVQLRTVADDKSIGKIVPGFRKGYIQAGDKVAAKLR